MAARALALGGDHVGLGDRRYPRRLAQLPEAPFGLFLRGSPDALAVERPAVAIIGSRRATVAGVSLARKIASELASEEVVIVSGLAAGIDGTAHEGALDEGGTVAVLGTGVDVAYPRRNVDLAERITVSRGALATEYRPGTPPVPWEARLPAIPRRKGISAGRHRVGAIVDHSLTTSRVLKDLPHAIDRAGLRRMMRLRARHPASSRPSLRRSWGRRDGDYP